MDIISQLIVNILESTDNFNFNVYCDYWRMLRQLVNLNWSTND